MAPPENRNEWSDFDWFTTEYLSKQVVATLKQFAGKIETQTRRSVGIRAGDRKADIVYKIAAAFKYFKDMNDKETYANVRAACEMLGAPVRNYAYAPPPTYTAGMSSSSSFSTPSAAGLPGRYAHPSTYRAPNAPGPSRTTSSWSSTGNVHTAYTSRAAVLQDWKPNPMWRPVKALSNMESLPDIAHSENSHTRRERRLQIVIPQDVIDKLNYSRLHPKSSPHHSVRLFCTSSEYYKPPNTPYNINTAHINNQKIPIEYPNSPDVVVDSQGIPFKEKGLRGKPGSAPPFDLDKSHRGLPRNAGTMTTVTLGHTGPTVGKKKDQSKRFYFQVVFCEMTTKDELHARVARLIPISAADSLAMQKRQEDDDIEMGASRMNLKDPLSYMRIAQPVRSSKCTHLQCFEAKWWIEGNEKHPQFLCPLCNKELKFDDLILDGYSLDILNAVPDSYEEVIIESDYSWHTEDGKYGSEEWMAAHGPNQLAPAPAPAPAPMEDAKPRLSPSKSPPLASPHDRKGKRKAIEILSSDSEDDDVPLSRNGNGIAPPPSIPVPPPALNRLPSHTSTNGATRQHVAAPATSGVIDLTLSSDEDETDDDEEDADGRINGAGFQRPSVGGASSKDAGSRPIPLKNSNLPRGPIARSPGVFSNTNAHSPFVPQPPLPRLEVPHLHNSHNQAPNGLSPSTYSAHSPRQPNFSHHPPAETLWSNPLNSSLPSPTQTVPAPTRDTWRPPHPTFSHDTAALRTLQSDTNGTANGQNGQKSSSTISNGSGTLAATGNGTNGHGYGNGNANGNGNGNGNANGNERYGPGGTIAQQRRDDAANLIQSGKRRRTAAMYFEDDEDEEDEDYDPTDDPEWGA